MTVYQPSYTSDPNASPQIGQRPKDQGLGGFPGPIQISETVARRFLPRLHARLGEWFVTSNKGDNKTFQRLTEEFSNLIIGRNSDFNTDDLTDDELEELGGLEYVTTLV